MSTCGRSIATALRMRVSMSATGSVIMAGVLERGGGAGGGASAPRANVRENGGGAGLTSSSRRASSGPASRRASASAPGPPPPPASSGPRASASPGLRSGRPSCRISSRPSSSFRAVVTMTIFIPCWLGEAVRVDLGEDVLLREAHVEVSRPRRTPWGSARGSRGPAAGRGRSGGRGTRTSGAPRSVTITPTSVPSRSRNWEMLFVAFRRAAFWPAMIDSMSWAWSISLLSRLASPSPMLTTIFLSFGSACSFSRPSSFFSSGRTSASYFVCRRGCMAVFRGPAGIAAGGTPLADGLSRVTAGRRGGRKRLLLGVLGLGRADDAGGVPAALAVALLGAVVGESDTPGGRACRRPDRNTSRSRRRSPSPSPAGRPADSWGGPS